MSTGSLIFRGLLNSTKSLRRGCVAALTESSKTAQLMPQGRHGTNIAAPRAAASLNGAPLALQPCATASSFQACNQDTSAYLAGAIAASALVAVDIGEPHEITSCESSCSTNNSSNSSQDGICCDGINLPPNPLWPSGVPQEMVDKFVDEILADPNINIASIPDTIEREIYVNTVLLTLNIVYETVGSFHGMDMFGHVIELHRVDDDEVEHVGASDDTDQSDGSPEKTLKQRVRRAYSRNAYGPGSIDHAALEAVADRLLANKAVNQPLIPDVVERQLYINCLKLVFRLLDAIAHTLRITMCGHDIRMMFEPCSDQSTRDWIKERLQKRAGDTSSKLTLVDLAAVEKYARQVGAAPKDRNDLNFLGKMFDRGQREMEVQLNKTLYALILGIVDDLLEDTVFQFLSDRIRMDVVARRSASTKRSCSDESSVDKGTGAEVRNESGVSLAKRKAASATVPVGAFSLGVAVGAGLVVSVFTAWRR